MTSIIAEHEQAIKQAQHSAQAPLFILLLFKQLEKSHLAGLTGIHSSSWLTLVSPEDCPRVLSLIYDSVATPGVGCIKSSLGTPIHGLLYCMLHMKHTLHEAWERD